MVIQLFGYDGTTSFGEADIGEMANFPNLVVIEELSLRCDSPSVVAYAYFVQRDPTQPKSTAYQMVRPVWAQRKRG